MTAWLTRVLTATLRSATRTLPPDRRLWADAVRAEAGAVPAGAPRLRWVAGGLVLVTQEAAMGRKIFYWLGVAAVAAAAGWAVWLSWRTAPAADPQTVTDRFRVLAGVVALAVLPWVGRARGLFGPVGPGIIARLARLAGLAAICRLGTLLVQSDSHVGIGIQRIGFSPFAPAQEITGLALLGAAVALAVIAFGRQATGRPAREPQMITLWALAAMVLSPALLLIPVQVVTVAAVAAVLAGTARGSLVLPGSLVAGVAASLPAAAIYWGLARVNGDLPGMLFIVLAIALLSGIAAGAAAVAFGAGGTRAALVRQGMYAGLVAGVAGGLLLTQLALLAGVVLLALGPAAALAGGMAGAAFAADHRRSDRPARSWYSGIFVSKA